jgi:hypothetical protein
VFVTTLVGKRILATLDATTFGRRCPEEYRVLEVSPSGNFVRLQNAHGNKFWRMAGEVAVLEELKIPELMRPEPEPVPGRGSFDGKVWP